MSFFQLAGNGPAMCRPMLGGLSYSHCVCLAWVPLVYDNVNH
jgi:hypothetical protein